MPQAVGQLPLRWVTRGEERCRRRPKEPVDLAEITNRFHVAAVHPIHETILRANDSHQPPIGWLETAFEEVGRMPSLPLSLLFFAAFIAGWCVPGGQAGVNSLAAVYYPTYLRSTGIGASLGFGRIGAIIW